ncbi:nibrin isoform X2 [Apis dorsata]|uniref:nibrin isoform X2 n=1 Tax=Apis dorsata TaxID=7462 RepID=UPI0003DF557D|nr:nibrin isoform X2 [Apis dorsata]
MWYLIDPDGDYIYLKVDREIIFGRKKGDIILKNDESISRLHASIRIKEDKITSTCIITDLQSKYGTFIFREYEMIEVTQDGYNLQHKDKIRFGLQDNLFTVVYIPLITLVSTLNQDDRKKLECLMDEIDGAVLYDWLSICTHLTVSKAKLTEKVTCAMAYAIPIITMDYWDAVKIAIDNGQDLPEIENFVPPIGESLINKQKLSLFPNINRTKLFKDLIFIHFSTIQFKIYKKIIKMAGGTSHLYSKKNWSVEELCAPNIVVLQYSDNESTQLTQNVSSEYDLIYNALRADKRKMVSEAEIPLAILHCSLQKYCNPAYKFGKLLKRLKPKCDSSKILNLDTQDVVSNVKILPKIISNISINTDLSIEKSKHTIKIIPDSCNDLKNQELLNVDFKQSVKEIKYNKSQYIKETNTSDDNKIFMKTDLNIQDDKCITKIISESSDDFNSQESSNEDFNNTSVKELKCNELQCIKELKDIFSDTPTINKNIKMQSKQNIINIPKTNRNIISESSSFLNILTKSTQHFMQSENLQIKKNENIQKFEEFKNSVINKKIKLNEVNSERENFLRNSELKEIKSNINNYQNFTQILTDNKSDDIFEINNSKDENMEIQVVKPCKNYFHTDINDKNCKIIQTSEKNRKRSKKTCKIFNEYDIDEEFTVSIRKKLCLENANVELIMFNGEQKNSNTLTKFHSSFLRNHFHGKTFKKVYNLIPKKRITLDDMYVWNKCDITNI